MIECVPNFSEGRDPRVVEAIVAAIDSVPGVTVAGWEMDADHHRSVVTFAGILDDVIEGAVRGVAKAAELIDLNQHAGVHPRVGAADVVPFIPIGGASMDLAVQAAHRAGEEIWQRAGVPVYFYGGAARMENRSRLERVRRPGFDGAGPDVGDIPSHPTAGASVVGARDFLIAYNVLLDTPDVELAKSIAKEIRESSGGMRHVKALGLYLAHRERAQVSMNLTKFTETDLDAVWDAIARRAPIVAGEIIGFVPHAAYAKHPQFFEHAENFSEDRILEVRLKRAAPGTPSLAHKHS